MVLSLKINTCNYVCKMGYLIFVSAPEVVFMLFKIQLAVIAEVEPLPETN